ncbi:outer membrane protein transport protein [Halomonas sp. EGI 63088]|uniref:Outer membrane protein transport protein n=1 Tax=Halomonas flagellata TaxID=2920385 RepID=A0ABS9RPW8_9GAMM|nr:TonB-dependent receptor [Halomonas flagellata]MCH4561878.1 outer membrane protein transport protein [Halomonas flagellata]
MHNKFNKLSMAVAIASSALVASQAFASGFQVREQSAKTLANALSNAAAGAEDAGFMAYNPAAIGNIDGNQVVGGLAYIDADFELRNAEASDASGLFDFDRGGSRQGGEAALVPSFAAKTRLKERFDLGLAVYAPYGLSTEYDEDWIGRYHAIESELETIDFQPTLNYRASDRLNLAVGLRAQYADATLSNAIDFGSAAAMQGLPGATPGQNDVIGEVTGDDWGYGYILGALFQATEKTRLGIGYRSEIDLTLDGELKVKGTDPVSDGAIDAGLVTGTGGKAELTTPANLNLGVYHQLTDRLALMANAEWTEWSSFDELVVEFEDGRAPSRTEENWDNTWAFSVGANYALTPQWLLRAGLGHDETPIPGSEFRTPRVPDADRTWATLGATWMPTADLGITAGYMRVFGDDVDMNQDGTKEENATRGNLSGTYEVSADVFALSVDYRF